MRVHPGRIGEVGLVAGVQTAPNQEHSMLSKILPKNEHSVERVIRVVAGLALLSITVVGPKTLWGLLGLVLVLTGLVGSCPIYSIFGFSTCKARADEATG